MSHLAMTLVKEVEASGFLVQVSLSRSWKITAGPVPAPRTLAAAQLGWEDITPWHWQHIKRTPPFKTTLAILRLLVLISSLQFSLAPRTCPR